MKFELDESPITEKEVKDCYVALRIPQSMADRMDMAIVHIGQQAYGRADFMRDAIRVFIDYIEKTVPAEGAK